MKNNTQNPVTAQGAGGKSKDFSLLKKYLIRAFKGMFTLTASISIGFALLLLHAIVKGFLK